MYTGPHIVHPFVHTPKSRLVKAPDITPLSYLIGCIKKVAYEAALSFEAFNIGLNEESIYQDAQKLAIGERMNVDDMGIIVERKEKDSFIVYFDPELSGSDCAACILKRTYGFQVERTPSRRMQQFRGWTSKESE